MNPHHSASSEPRDELLSLYFWSREENRNTSHAIDSGLYRSVYKHQVVIVSPSHLVTCRTRKIVVKPDTVITSVTMVYAIPEAPTIQTLGSSAQTEAELDLLL